MKLSRFVDSLLLARYQNADIDTNYITRPKTKWTVKCQINLSGAKIKAMGQESGGGLLPSGQQFETVLEAERKTTISIGVSYLGLSLSLSLNPAKMLGRYHDYELGLRSYGKRFGYDIAYQDAHNFKGWHEGQGVRYEITTAEDMFRLRTLNVNTYYVFNHRRFSYPAAFTHSYIQQRSAGSFLLAASGQAQHGKVNGENNETNNRRPALNFKMTNIGIGAGYGYNYVPGSGWLFHISALPTLIVYTHTSLTTASTSIPLHYHFPEVIITGRNAIVKQIGRNKFAGLSMVYYFTSIGNKDNLSIRNRKWLARLYFGIRL